jgi:chromosome partitioning protein
MRSEANRKPGLSCVHYPDEKALRAQVIQQCEAYDDVVIDVGGRDSAALRMSLLLSDLIVIPVQPRSIDVWAFADMADLIDRADDTRAERGRPPLLSIAVLNLADSGAGADNASAIEALAEFSKVRWTDTPLRRRKAFANASGLGLSVAEMSPRDLKACSEMDALVGNVFTIAERAVSTLEETV